MKIVGQTPRKLFTTPHPQRFTQGPSSLPIGTSYGVEENYELLEQSKRPAARGNKQPVTVSIRLTRHSCKVLLMAVLFIP